MTDIARIRAAALRLRDHVRETPMLSSPALDALAGRRVLVKAECLQHTGSFKARGAWAAVIALPPGRGGVIAYSSGNHGQGVARAAAASGREAVVVMPARAPAVKIARTRALGAEVILYDPDTEGREALGQAIATGRGLHLIRPYDDPDVIAGQGTAGLEIAAQAQALGVSRAEVAEVLVCCGGGGLSAGIALALEAEAPALCVRTVEPAGFDDMARSLNAGEPLRNDPGARSVCDAILTPEPGRLTFPILQRLAGPGLAITDDEALEAVALAFAHLRVVLEPGGAVALAAALFRPESLTGDTVIAVASGGNVDPALFAAALSRLA